LRFFLWDDSLDIKGKSKPKPHAFVDVICVHKKGMEKNKKKKGKRKNNQVNMIKNRSKKTFATFIIIFNQYTNTENLGDDILAAINNYK
jgi:hypothetical protein